MEDEKNDEYILVFFFIPKKTEKVVNLKYILYYSSSYGVH